jgi:probable HAF family extracellular repeat protein
MANEKGAVSPQDDIGIRGDESLVENQREPSMVKFKSVPEEGDTSYPDDYVVVPILGRNKRDELFAVDLNYEGQIAVNIDHVHLGRQAYKWERGELTAIDDASRYSIARAVGDSGWVTGERATGFVFRPFVWEKGIARTAGRFSPTLRTWDMPNAINSHGDVVGSSRYAPIVNPGWERAVYWRRTETETESGTTVRWPIRDLGTLGGDLWCERPVSIARDINNEGQIVGSSPAPGAEPGTWETRAFLWQEDEIDRPGTSEAKMIDLGTLGGAFSSATKINEAGQIIGRSTMAEGDGRIPHSTGFFWSDGVLHRVPAFEGEQSSLFALNDDGWVVGSAETEETYDDGRAVRRAFRWSEESMKKSQDLGTLGGRSSVAFDINNAGQIVGSAETADGRNQAFLWINDTMYSLAREEWKESSAQAINEAGQVLVRATVDVDQREETDLRYFLATPWKLAWPLWPDDAELIASAIAETSITMTWPEPDHRDGVGEYQLSQDGRPIVTVPAGERTYTVEDLLPGEVYEFKVDACSIEGIWSADGPRLTVETSGKRE